MLHFKDMLLIVGLHALYLFNPFLLLLFISMLWSYRIEKGTKRRSA